VLDTAPSRHALDFIDSPRHLISFFDEGILSRFVRNESSGEKGFWSGLLKTGQEKALALFKGVFGSTFFQELGDLLNLSRPLHQRLVQVATAANDWIRSPDAQVLMISAPDNRSFREIELMTADLRSRGLQSPYRLLINRCLPSSEPPAWITAGDSDFSRQVRERWAVQQRLLQDVKKLERWVPCILTYPSVNPRQLTIDELLRAGQSLLSQWPFIETAASPEPLRPKDWSTE
jgi:hypothetical protein